MVVLTENTVLARTRAQDLNSVVKLNCWGCELTCVEIVRKMPNVEVLALSVNSISTLEDFSYCKNLRELYIRKNEIKNLNEVIFLKDLPKLQNLWLSDNPCAIGEHYRLAVLRMLPNLEKLDNIMVNSEELDMAMIHGPDLSIPGEPSLNIQEEECVPVIADAEIQPDLVESEKPEIIKPPVIANETPFTPTESPPTTPQAFQAKVQTMEDHQTESPTAQYQDESAITPEPEHLQSYKQMHNKSELQDSLCQSFESKVSYSARSSKLLSKGGRVRNSNILSAVLCLIKEVDYASLEVIETAIHCRMEEIEDN